MIRAGQLWAIADFNDKLSFLRAMKNDIQYFDREDRDAIAVILAKAEKRGAEALPAPTTEVIELAKAGKKIQAIKLYRETFGAYNNIGLYEAKIAVEAIK